MAYIDGFKVRVHCPQCAIQGGPWMRIQGNVKRWSDGMNATHQAHPGYKIDYQPVFSSSKQVP